MNKSIDIKGKLKALCTSKYAPFIFMFFAILILNLMKKFTNGDDVWFSKITTGEISSEVNSMGDYYGWRYNTWSSRLIIETFLIFFAKNCTFLWCIIDSLIYVLLAHSIVKLFGKKDCSINFKWICVFLIICIPYGLMSSAGWIATSLNYSWAIALGLFSLIPIRKALDNEIIKKREYIYYILSALYACNVEQVCLCIFAIYFIFNIYLIFKKKIKPINVIIMLVSIASLIFILTCPGNDVRVQQETDLFYKDFVNLNILQKIEIGIVSTMQYFMFKFNIIYVIFTILLMINVFKNSKNILFKIISIYPVIMGLAFSGVLGPITSNILPNMYNTVKTIDVQNSLILNNSATSIALFAMICFNYVAILISTYGALGKSNKTIICLIALMAGICTRLIMGFAPSVYASGDRTEYTFIITMLISIFIIITNKFEDEKKINTIKNILLFLAVLYYLNSCFLSLTIV